MEGIPPEVSKIIEKDLGKNPLPAGTDRMYRVFINRNLTNPTEDAQVVRVIVKSQGSSQRHQSPARSHSVLLHQPPIIAPSQQQIHYILPPIDQSSPEQPHRYTPPPHKSIILPSANAMDANSRMSHYNEEEQPKKPKKRFSFFN